MSDTVITVENLSKKYLIGHEQSGNYKTLRDVVSGAAKRVRARLRHPFNGGAAISNGRKEEFWALKDVSFEIKRGEVVGIIGRNGAGKSTLLKILSRITEPATGRVRIKGRVASLLEVGTGFHPELTGRENIFLNGAILGMSKTEIKRKFDEIVAFAEVEKFLDTPVKRYSSGMYVRLAFAVAAHLEPEILIVDEVLAVGDAQFQKKCLGKMGEVSKAGRTVLFVSHNMVAIQSLCRRAIWLDAGNIIADGASTQVVSDYLGRSMKDSSSLEEAWEDLEVAPGNEAVRLHRVRVRPRHGSPSDPLTMRTPFLVEVEYWNLLPDARLNITLHLYTEQDVIAFTTGSGLDPSWGEQPMLAGLYRSVCFFPGDLFNSGRHRFAILVVKDKTSVIYCYESAISFDILDLRDRQIGWYGKEPGVLQPALQWATEFIGGTPRTDSLLQEVQKV
jgi:homopolymeric O-antigen transport system ATP-binding protein